MVFLVRMPVEAAQVEPTYSVVFRDSGTSQCESTSKLELSYIAAIPPIPCINDNNAPDPPCLQQGAAKAAPPCHVHGTRELLS